jgi:7-cyano-7-deazaguanine synthase in queuosine biosynthesis
MSSQVVLVEGLCQDVRRLLSPTATVQLDWRSPSRNVNLDLSALELEAGCLSPIAADLVDLVSAVYLADLAILRGRNEQFVRTFDLHIPVRALEAWQPVQADLSRLLYLLTGDNVGLHLYPREHEPSAPPAEGTADSDCVCLLSGGLDSLAGAVMLLRTGRNPLFVTHRSGNPTIAEAQRRVCRTLSRLSSGLHYAPFTLLPRPTPRSLPFPPADLREPSRRSRSLVFMGLGAVAAAGLQATEVYVCENGILTAALPLSPSRVGALSTRSTHPAVLTGFTAIAQRLGISCQTLNPFLYRTKAELITEVLRPVLRINEIQDTVSCWMSGRRHRQCGGCVPCLLRRVSMLAAGLPDEAYEIDVFSSPDDYRGTDAYVNLVDLLSYVACLLAYSEVDLLLQAPALLDMHAYGVSVPDAVAMLKRFAREVSAVVEQHFPASARLMASLADGQQDA